MSTETRDALREALAARNCKAGHPMGGDAAFSIELDMLEAEAVAALRATDVPSDMTTCVECFRPVAEVDAETGECRECFARAALATPEPDRPPCGLCGHTYTSHLLGVACCDCIGFATPEPDA